MAFARYLKFALTALSFCLSLWIQADVVWLNHAYDFGLIKEAAGPKEGSVRFINRGPDEVVVTNAKATCGCTNVDFPKDPIAPGDTATISFTYNPTGRPGKFEKSIRVYIGEFEGYRIKIKGNVLGTPQSLASMYPVELGSLRLSDPVINAGDLTIGNTRNYFLNAYNQSLDSISPAWSCADKAISITSSAPKIGPGDILTFSIMYDSAKKNEIGPVEIPIDIISDANISEPESVTVPFKVTVTPDFASLSVEQIDNGPRCYISPSPIDLGILSEEKTYKFSFNILNEGKEKLNIYKLLPESAEITVKRFPSDLKPDKTGRVDAVISTKQLPSGAFNIKINVLTNDPLHPTRTVSVVGIKEIN